MTMKLKMSRMTIVAACLAAGLLAGCGGVRSAKLSEMKDPEVSKKMLEDLSQEERMLLVGYIASHMADLNYKTTIGDAIDQQRAAEKKK
jgi:hypothetical protein